MRLPAEEMFPCFAALRPLLCVRGVERHGGVLPVEFARLLPLLNDRAAVLEAINILLERKHDAPEMGRAPRNEPDPLIPKKEPDSLIPCYDGRPTQE